MEQSQLPFLTIAELARLIKTQEVSPVEVVEAHLERIERLNPQVHAFLTVCHEDARRAARAAEQEIAHGAYRGPLHETAKYRGDPLKQGVWRRTLCS